VFIISKIVILVIFLLIAPAVLAIECGNMPTSSCSVSQDTTFSQGIYSVNLGIIINKSNLVLDCNNSWIYGANLNFGIRAQDKTGITIKNCKLTNYEYGVYLRNTSYSRVLNNTINDNSIYGLFLRESDNNEISYNQMVKNVNGIYAQISDNNVFYKNHLSNNSIEGIEIDFSLNNAIISNEVINNTDAYGIWIKGSGINGSNNNSVNSNTLIKNRYGLFLSCAYENIIMNNIVKDNTETTKRGVYLQNFTDSKFKGNTVTNNFQGIYVNVNLTNNVIEYNNIFGNNGDSYSYDLYNNQRENVSAQNNWWGTTNTTLIDRHIYDYQDNSTKGRVDYANWLAGSYNISASYVVQLHNGWNMVSFPLESFSKSLPAALETLQGKYDKVLAYNNDGSNNSLDNSLGNSWVSYRTDKPGSLNKLQMIDETKGFWINMLEPATLEIQGVKTEEVVFNLRQGWNLISYPSLEEKNVSYVFGEVNDSLERVFMYNTTWKSYKAGSDQLKSMAPGFGYWVKVKEDTAWVFENSKFTFENKEQSFNIQLNTGWNLISLPLQPDDIAVSNVVSGSSGQIVIWYYNASTDSWTSYDTNAPFPWLNTLNSMSYGKAYWVKSVSNQNLAIQGTLVRNYNTKLKPGWNFVGYNLSTTAMPAPINGLATPIVTWAYYTSTDEWKSYDTTAPFPWLNTLAEMTAGKGYWIKSSVEQNWTI
jgi:parallel beta-helix repeat protein